MGRALGAVALVLFVAACGNDEVTGVDAAQFDAAQSDAAEVDATLLDAAFDAAAVDAAQIDAAQIDAAQIDAAQIDAAQIDASQIDATPAQAFKASLTPRQEVQEPPVSSTASASATCALTGMQLVCTITVSMLSDVQAAHIHGPAPAAQNAGVAVGLTLPVTDPQTFNLTAQQVADLEAGHQYLNIHTTGSPSGEIRGQLIRDSEILYATQMTGAGAGRGFAGCIANAARTQLSCSGSAIALAESLVSAQLVKFDGSTVAATFTIDAAGTSPRFSGSAVISPSDFAELSTFGWSVRLSGSTLAYSGSLTAQ
ncbi:MAG TPA: CHRD domain-containing protein [Kofleriaceae bacterium]|nr:CHRD domain-containing protein [Kofleriaceae bacterium]